MLQEKGGGAAGGGGRGVAKGRERFGGVGGLRALALLFRDAVRRTTRVRRVGGRLLENARRLNTNTAHPRLTISGPLTDVPNGHPVARH